MMLSWARPKSGKLSSSPDDIYHSSDEEDRTLEGLLKELAPSSTSSTLPTTPGSLTPKWEDVGSSRGDSDKEMAQVWEQTRLFDQQLNNSKLDKSEKSTVTKPVQGGREGKRDANGFINCTSCKTVHQTTQEFVVHCRSSKHIENSIWAEKLATGGSADLKNTLGWGGFGATGREDHGAAVPGSTWEHELRPSKDPAPLSPLDSVIGQGGRSRADTPESRRTSEKLEDEVSNLRAELEKERAAKAKAVAEVERERAGKRMLEKQSLIVENTLKAEEAKAREFKEMMERLSEKLKRQEFEAKSGIVDSSVSAVASEVERAKVRDLEESLAAEVAKNEAHAKVIKKLKEKVERAEKGSVKEKDLKLLAEKTLELVSKDKRGEESKRKEAEAALAKALAKVKEVEGKVKEEMRKRIAAEVELATVKEKEAKRKAEVDLEQSALAASVKQLIKEKEEIERKNDEARVEAVNRLEARGCQGSLVQKIVRDSEDIVKKTLERAVASNEDVDSYGDVSKIFKIVSEAMLKPGSSMNSEISDMVSEIAGTYSAGLEEMKQVNEETVNQSEEGEKDFETVASEPNIETNSEQGLLEGKDCVEEEVEVGDKVEIKKSEEMKNVDRDDGQDYVEDLKCDEAEADVEPEHDEKTVDNAIKDDQAVKESKGEAMNQNGDDQEMGKKDPFDALVDQSEKHQPSETVAQDDEVFEKEALAEDTGKAMDMSRPISVSSSRENMSEDVDGLDRFPKLGLDHEIDPYLGSPPLSRAWIPLEKVEEMANDGNDLTLTVEPQEGEKVKELDDEREEKAASREPRLSSSGSSPAAWPLEMSESSTSGLGSEVKELLEENTRLYTLEGNMQEMQHMIVTLGSTVTSLNNQVEDSKMRNGLLLKTVEVMQEKNP